MKIDTALIPVEVKKALAAAVTEAANSFYADEKNEARYQAWRKGREHEIQDVPRLRSESGLR